MNHTFEGKCPSKAQVVKVMTKLLNEYNECEISWGEQAINVIANPYNQGKYIGYGWIRSISGQDLAYKF